jgi:hypothetical protein
MIIYTLSDIYIYIGIPFKYALKPSLFSFSTRSVSLNSSSRACALCCVVVAEGCNSSAVTVSTCQCYKAVAVLHNVLQYFSLWYLCMLKCSVHNTLSEVLSPQCLLLPVTRYETLAVRCLNQRVKRCTINIRVITDC